MRLSLCNRRGGARRRVRFLSCPDCPLRSKNGEPVPGAGGLLSQSATFEVLTESQIYVNILSITRLPMLALTVRNFPSYQCLNRLCVCRIFVCTCIPSSVFCRVRYFGVQQLIKAVSNLRGCHPALSHTLRATRCVLAPRLFCGFMVHCLLFEQMDQRGSRLHIIARVYTPTLWDCTTKS